MEVYTSDDRACGRGPPNSIRNVVEGVYSEALGIPNEEINPELSFVALGGDSFQAIKLYQKFQEERLNVSFQQILAQSFEEIVRAFTAQLDQHEKQASSELQASLGAGHPGPRCGHFPLLHGDQDLCHLISALKDRNLSLDDIESIYPASNMQESMYVAQQMGSESDIIYQTKGLFTVPVDCDSKVLDGVWRKIIRRHQSLRTFFVENPDNSSGHLLFSVVLRDLPKSAQVVAEDFTCATSEEVRNDLAVASTDGVRKYGHQIKMYSALDSDAMKALHGRRLCKIEIPHMVVDGASLCILLDEMRQGLVSNGTVLQELPAPTQYESYIAYLQKARDQEDFAMDYWIQYLDGAQACNFPSLCPPPAARNGSKPDDPSSPPAVSGATDTLHVSVSYSDLRAFCRRHNATISNSIQAAWAILLYSYTEQSDICYGYLSSGRNVPIPGAATIVGPMMNMLVSRFDSVGSLSLGALVSKVRDDFISALPHQAVALHKVQSLLGLGQTRLFNTIVTSYFAPLMLLDDDGAENPIKLLESHNASNFDLVVKAVYSSNDIRVRLVYSSSALSAHAAKGVAKTFESILHKMTAASGLESETISAMDTISSQERAIISEWNRKSSTAIGQDSMAPDCVHDLIVDRVRLQPSAQAIWAWDGRMDYETLDRVSSDIARQICSMRAGPGAYIALCFEKSMWFPVALLSVLKSGNAFVPLDLSNPLARIAKMTNILECGQRVDGLLPLVLCSRAQHGRCSSLARQVLVLDGTCANQSEPGARMLGEMEPPWLPKVPPSHPAYVIFTSGSTGAPKGVVVEHRSYSFAARAHSNGLRLDNTSRVLQFASYGFDTSIEDHLSTLIAGGCLCIPSEADRLDLGALADFARTSRANWAHLTPSLADTFTPADIPTIKTMVLGGEPMTARNIINWAKASGPSAQSGDQSLIQVYGPSECCVTSSIQSTVSPGSPEMDLGTAVPGCGIWITRVDDPDFLCPIGVAGEILVEGPILARGYIQQPDLTSAAFLKGLSWARDGNRRFYRTGDVARYVYDSVGQIRLHFVGRKDSQVKIHGQRIELGEIERTLGLQCHIRQALATIPRRGPFQDQLLGFISFPATGTASSPHKPTTMCKSGDKQPGVKLVAGSWRSQVRDAVDFLQDRLPSYMVPEIFICVEDVPKNISGKLDRKQIQEYVEELDTAKYQDVVSRMNDGQHQDNDRPGSEIEMDVRTLWSEVLRVPESQIQWDTSFFFLGGDSISAMMISHAARQKGISLTAGDIMRHRRIDRLAEVAAKERRPLHEHKSAASVSMPEENISIKPFPLSPIQRLHFSTHGVTGDSLDQQTVVLEIMEIGTTQRDHRNLLKKTFGQLLRIHPMLRARFRVNQEMEVEQTIASETDSHNLRLRLHSDSDANYVLECIQEACFSINISKGPLIAADIFEGDGARIMVSISIHHLVVDTVSWRIILRDLESSLKSDGLRPLDPEPVSFWKWSRALAEEFSTPDTEKDFQDVATATYSDATPSQEALQDFWGMHGKSNTFNETLFQTFELGAECTAALMASREETGFELVDLLCSALLESFHSVFGRMPQLYVEGHGREPFCDAFVDIGSVVGWFTTFAPLLLPQVRDPDTNGSTILGKVSEARSKLQLNGLACFALQQLAEKVQNTCPAPMEIAFNYLGAFQQLESTSETVSAFRLHDEDEFQTRLSDMKLQQRAHSARCSLISVLFRHTKDGLRGEITWNKNMGHQADLLAWVTLFESTLGNIRPKHANAQPSSQGLSGGIHLAESTSCSTPTALPAAIHTSPDTADRILAFAHRQFGLGKNDIERIYPCSPIQDSIMLSQLKTRTESALDIYDQHFVFEVVSSNNIDAIRLQKAWQEIVRRHAIMRTMFIEDDAGFFQIVLRQHSPDVEFVTLDKAIQGDTVTDPSELQSIPEEYRLKHPLSGSILHKLTILEQPSTKGASRVLCRLTKSHLISCGHTSRLLIKDFLDAYDGLDSHPREEYSLFIDYVFQQDMEDMTRWWAKFLDGANPCILPRTLRRSCQNKTAVAIQSDATDAFLRVSAAIPDKLSLSLACQRHELSSTSIVCAAWGITLRTYMANLDDVMFGLMFGGRDLPIPGAHSILGPMINMLPARVQFKPGMTLAEVCQESQRGYIEQLSRQTVPLGRIQNCVDSLRGQGQIFNTIVNVQKVRQVENEQDPERTRARLLFSHDTTEFDVALSVTETDRAMDVSLEFRADFMSQIQAERTLQVFVGVIEKIIDSPSSTIDKLNVATALDFAQLKEWNSTPLKQYHGCIHEMIQTTSRAPGQAECQAVSSWDGNLTYWELEYLSSALASKMVAQGVRPGDVIALCFEKSLWAVVSMLAVAKAGAAFVQIHPDYPVKRCKTIVDQAKPTMGLASHTQEHKLLGVLGQGTVITVPWSKYCLARIPASVQDIELHPSHTDPSHAMYMIATSGTTGTPKMVVIEHQSFCSAVTSNMEKLQINSESRVLQFTDYCFDACLEEIFTVLVAGGCICIPSEAQRLSDIPSFIKQHNVNWAALTPSFMRTMQVQDIVPPVKFITVHAEPMSQALVDGWAGRVQIRPSYGPSECSVTSTVGADFYSGANAANIGWPVGCHAWVVSPDDHDILMPIGAVGELVLQGPIVGRGYLDDEARTAASFISPPAWAAHFLGDTSESNSKLALRMYKTGDLVRYDPEDGSLLIQARKDASQVKVRGQRIELKEIEHNLDGTGVIQNGLAIVPRQGELRGRIVLVVSLLCLDGKSRTADVPLQLDHGINGASRIRLVRTKYLDKIDAEDISRSIRTAKESLLRHLPRYMLPETWVVVEKLPVTISHKVDRQQVVQWIDKIDALSLESIHEFEVPEEHGSQGDTLDEEERCIRSVWGKVLGIDPASISLDQSFFQLGGNSLSAMDIKRHCTALGYHLSTQDVLSMPTVRQLARLAGQNAPAGPAKPRDQSQSTCTLDRQSLSPNVKNTLSTLGENVESIMHCSPFQTRMYRAFHSKGRVPYVYNNLVKFDQPTSHDHLPSEQRGELEINRLLHSWRQATERHSILRTIFLDTHSPDGSCSESYQVVLKDITPDTEVFHVDSTDDVLEKSQTHLEKFRQNAFRQFSAPHSLAILVDKSDPGTLYVHLILSHMLVDHVSLAHILSDFDLFYRGRSVDLLPPCKAFAEYIAQSSMPRARHDGGDPVRSFWETELRDTVPCILENRHLSKLFCPARNVSLPEKGICTNSRYQSSVKLTLDITESVKSLCKDAEVTMCTLMQFAWAVLLHILTGNQTVCFGYLFSDRDRVGDDKLEIVGPVLCLVMGHVTFSKNPGAVLDALRTLQKRNVADYSRAYSFDLTCVEQGFASGGYKILGTAAVPGREKSTPVLFNTLINYRNVVYSSPSNITATRHNKSIWKQDPHEQDIVLSFNERDDLKLDAELTYFAGMFNDASMQILMRSYSQVIEILSLTRPGSVEDLKEALSGV